FLLVASATFLLYDHLITLDLEIANVWTNKHQRAWHKTSFVLNRYLPEAVMIYVLQGEWRQPERMEDEEPNVVAVILGFARGLHDTEHIATSCRRFIWVFTISATTMVIVSQFAINLRVYHTWGLQKKMTTLLTIGFMVFNVAAGGLAIFVGLRLQDLTHFDSLLSHTCNFMEIPNELPYLYGLLAGFDLFLIVLAGYNALEKPHQTNSGVLNSFLMYGSILFFVRRVSLHGYTEKSC
ncbi:hypothetical protein L218DRAFT_886616, partial [Marasmius fiardii PR-910]